ncbi:chloride channel [Calderihabitans maritimus]|uniref:Chloride channel n=1 Tax=Calderihabitans maritimus TaxID=1246530 RepID=A0A1Z5HSS0_9FIRM|nr:chloride channel [Calderihabitans maritimus]
MGISFTHPYVLLLWPVILYLVFNWWKKGHQLHGVRLKAALALRFFMVTCLLLALAGLEFEYVINRQAVVFAVDVSASTEEVKKEAETWIKQAIAVKGNSDWAGVIAFGGEAMVEQPVSPELQFTRLETLPSPHATDIAAGLRLAGALLPGNARKRVVLISDGRQTTGDAVEAAKALKNQGVRVDVVPLKVSREREVLVSRLEAPEYSRQGEVVELKAVIESSFATGAVLRFFAGRNMILEQAVSLQAGENTFSVGVKENTPGFRVFRVVIEPFVDSNYRNNEAAAFTRVQGVPRILLVEGDGGEGKLLGKALAAAGFQVDLVTAERVPRTLAEFKQYATVVLANVPASALGERVMQTMRIAVRDLAMGLVMVGGEDSFGLGGYFKTPVEEALPVYMDLRHKEEVPSLGLVLVIDKSGSMSGGTGGVSKMELAKEAAIQATEILGPQDRIGVVAFDGRAGWVVPLQKLDDLREIQNLIGTIRASGGTDIYPGLNLAYEALKDAKTRLKHIILLTDGRSATSGDYQRLAEEMKKYKITLSTVAVGDDADTFLLSQLAEWGQGRYYFTDDIESIPRILTRETMLAARTYVVEETFTPKIGSNSPLVESLRSGVPALDGYVAVSPKETAEVSLVTHRDDPLLAHWQYGLGRTVAYTSDAAGRWSSRWVGRAGFARFWADLVTWTLPRDDTGLISVDTRLVGNRMEITAEVPFGTEESRVAEATIVGPELEGERVLLEPVGPGRFKGEFPSFDPGVYLIQVVLREGEKVIAAQSTGLAIPYSPEFRMRGTDPDFLHAIAEAGGGAVISEPREAFATNLAPVRGRTDWWPFFLMLAAFLLPFDVAVRRLWFSKEDWWRLRGFLAERLSNGEKVEDRSDETIGRLKRRKSEVARAKETLRMKVSTEEIKKIQGTPETQTQHGGQLPEQREDFTSKLLAAKKRWR